MSSVRPVTIQMMIAAALAAATALPARATRSESVTQPPCTVINGDFCVAFGLGYGAPPKVVREIAFDAPAAGTALVSFNGSGECNNDGTAPEVMDFETQIVDSPKAKVKDTGPGGNRVEAVIMATASGASSAFNLASQRVIGVKPGKQSFYFKLLLNRLDADVQCVLFNDTFSIHYDPA